LFFRVIFGQLALPRFCFWLHSFLCRFLNPADYIVFNIMFSSGDYLALYTLHKLAGFVRKWEIFFGRKIAKCFAGKGLKIFIFLVNSRIVQAHLVRKFEKKV